jgi:hypothetical protein
MKPEGKKRGADEKIYKKKDDGTGGTNQVNQARTWPQQCPWDGTHMRSIRLLRAVLQCTSFSAEHEGKAKRTCLKRSAKTRWID